MSEEHPEETLRNAVDTYLSMRSSISPHVERRMCRRRGTSRTSWLVYSNRHRYWNTRISAPAMYTRWSLEIQGEGRGKTRLAFLCGFVVDRRVVIFDVALHLALPCAIHVAFKWERPDKTPSQKWRKKWEKTNCYNERKCRMGKRKTL